MTETVCFEYLAEPTFESIDYLFIEDKTQIVLNEVSSRVDFGVPYARMLSARKDRSL